MYIYCILYVEKYVSKKITLKSTIYVHTSALFLAIVNFKRERGVGGIIVIIGPVRNYHFPKALFV